MKLKLNVIATLASLLFLAHQVFSAADSSSVEIMKELKISGELGGRVGDKPWSSYDHLGKLTLVFNVDPDEEKVNEEFYDQLEKVDFPEDNFLSVAIVNMEATWLPNAAINLAINNKQKKFPQTVYVKDLKKQTQKVWGLKDHSSNCLLLGPKGNLLWRVDGKVSKKEGERLIALIWTELEAFEKDNAP